jgi:hypothetical protein
MKRVALRMRAAGIEHGIFVPFSPSAKSVEREAKKPPIGVASLLMACLGGFEPLAFGVGVHNIV